MNILNRSLESDPQCSAELLRADNSVSRLAFGEEYTFSDGTAAAQVPLVRQTRFQQIIGNSQALRSVLDEVESVAFTDATVLVLGETGTGKELIARTVHETSRRRGRPFVKVNCAAIPLDLLESELFGHERGAFTGALAQRIGRFEMADGGTLFLDEIGDIPLSLQPKLLRALQEKEFERLGSNRTHHTDVRLIAATHCNLHQMVKQGGFRSDLYYRLNVFPIVVPPLRDRREDITPLVRYFVETFARSMGKPIDAIPAPTLRRFNSYSWPGNVRELQNLIERAVILSRDGVLADPLPVEESPVPIQVPEKQTLKDAQKALILAQLQASGWLVGGPRGAAARLGLKRTTLLSKMKKLGITRPQAGVNANNCPPASETLRTIA